MVDTGATRRVAVAQGLMTVEGLSDRYVQGLGRPLRLVATGLRPIGGFILRDGQIEDAMRLEGRAEPDVDRLMRVGHPGEATSLGLTIRPVAALGEARALIVLSFDDGEDRPEEGFRAEIFTPLAVFDALASAVRDGRAQRLSIAAMTSLWVRESERDAPAGLPVSWHLGLDAEGRASEPARGLVESLEWQPTGVNPVTAPAAIDEEPEETTTDLLARIDWSLKQIALVLLFLLIVVALK